MLCRYGAVKKSNVRKKKKLRNPDKVFSNDDRCDVWAKTGASKAL